MIQIQNNEINLNQDKLSILYFSATWCGPCKILKPIMEEITKEIEDVDFFYIDINDNIEVTQKYGVMSIPTLIFLKDGENKNTIVGLQTKTNITNAINNIK